MENLHRIYNENIFQIFPIWADIHGVDMISSMTYSEKEIVECCNSLTNILLEVKDKYISHNIQECLYYLNDLKVHCHPYFYSDIVIASILYYQEFPVHMRNELLKDLSKIKEKAILIEKITSNFIENSSGIGLTRYELKVSLCLIIRRMKELEKLTNVYEMLKSQGVIAQFDRFVSYLDNRLKKNENINNDISLGEKKFTKYLNIFLNHSFNVESEMKKCEEIINVFFEKSKGFVTVDDTGFRNVQETLKVIYSELKGIFGEINFDLDIMEDSGKGNSYFMAGRSPCYILKNTSMKTQSVLRLNVVHEVYPGHFFLNKFLKENNLQNLIVANDRFINEGWSRFCEYFYANHFGNSEVKNEIEKKIFIMSLRAFVSIAFHTERMSKKEIMTFCMKYGINKADVLSLISSIIINPFEPLFYYLGFALFNANFNDSDKDNIQNKLLYLLEDGRIYE